MVLSWVLVLCTFVALKMDIVCFFETLTSICKTTQHQNPEEHQNKGYMVVSENKINI
jgi:hypothetical protein